MAAVGTRELTKYINERGMKLWEVKLMIPTGTTETSKQSQPIAINGLLQSLSIQAPNLLTDATFNLIIQRASGAEISIKVDLADNGSRVIHATDMLSDGNADAGNGIPIFADDNIKITFATAQTSGSLNFTCYLRGI